MQSLSISRLISSPSIVPLHANPIRNYLLNRQGLTRLLKLFPEYNLHNFTTTTLLNYQSLRKSHQFGDHVNPMKYFSADVYKLWKQQKEGFVFYGEVLNFKVKGIRIFENQAGVWPQLTVDMTHPQGKGYKTERYVLERKHQNFQLVDHWRFRLFPINHNK